MRSQRRSFWLWAATAAGTIAAFGAAAGTIREWAPWAWAGAFRQVAQVTYDVAISQTWNVLIQLRTQLAAARAAGDPAAVLVLEQQERRLIIDLERLEAEQAAIRAAP